MEEKVTMQEVIQRTVNTLSGIDIKASEVERIGIPVLTAVKNLEALLGAIELAAKSEEDDEEEEVIGIISQ